MDSINHGMTQTARGSQRKAIMPHAYAIRSPKDGRPDCRKGQYESPFLRMCTYGRSDPWEAAAVTSAMHTS